MEDIIKKIYNYSLEEIMGERFGKYSKYIIQDRAIPDVRDGLKPVQRRILYSMYKEKNTYDKAYKKSARAVGDVMGKYHPHGDSSIYDAIVRMSQDWKMREPFVDMQGNNGSIDGDSAAASRYTEARLSKIAGAMLKDIEKDTVAMSPNYDDTLLEPTVLPAKFPNLLVNGTTGISAGYATNIPPHNLSEVIDATIYRISNPNSRLDTIMNYIKGPDFPTGAIIEGIDGIRSAYETGKGRIIIKSKTRIEKNKIIIDSSSIDNYEIPDELMRQMRSSVILAGAILSRVKKATFSYPGGCDIGARPIDLHLKAFKDLGITIKEENGEIFCDSSNMVAGTITLDFPSVGATENIILAAALSNKVIYIKNAAMEPEIVDLQNYINKLGGSVSGAGTKDIKIVGVEKLEANIEYEIMPDRIEIGTLLCAAAITNGNITIKNVRIEHIIPIVYKLEEMGCEINLKEKEINLIANNRLKSCNLKTMPYPGFPTDMQPIIASCLGVAKGTSIIVENIFENRYKYLSELKRMGTRVTIEGRTAIIKGIKRYNAAKVEATDLRGGASLVLAALNAKGKTVISNIGYILRGYENIDEKLRRLGANIYVGEGEIIEKEKK